jgi:anti-sigma regulatory factor (Ser/Thr protein kinase)
MDSAERRLSPDRCTRDTSPVTYAQARDLTYGSRELGPPRNRRRPAAAAAAASAVTASPASPAASGSEPAHASGTAAPEGFAGGRGEPGDGPGDLGDEDGAGALSEMAFKAGTESVKAARDFTIETLREWRLDGLIEDAVIIASELVTNAIRHGAALAGPEDPPEVELAWQRFSSRVTCVVTDGSTRPPVLSAADMSSESGRGLQVVHAIAAAWGWMMIGAREKAVWATLLLPPGSLLPGAFVTTLLAGP